MSDREWPWNKRRVFTRLQGSFQKHSRVLTSLPSGPGGPLSPTSPRTPCQRTRSMFSHYQNHRPINSLHWRTFGCFLFFFSKHTASLISWFIQILISCCRFLIRWHLEHHPLILYFFWAESHSKSTTCANSSAFPTVSGTFHGGNLCVSKRRFSTRELRANTSGICPELFPNVQMRTPPPRRLMTEKKPLCPNKWWGRNGYLTCRPLGPDFPTGPGIPLKTETRR